MSTQPTGDWASQAAGTIERVVGQVRDQATARAITALRAIVFGVLLTFLGIAALVLFTAGAVRLIDSYLPGKVWAAHLLVGGIFFLAGLFVFSRRHPRSED